jgi:hypothetical protein
MATYRWKKQPDGNYSMIVSSNGKRACSHGWQKSTPEIARRSADAEYAKKYGQTP